MQVITFPFCKNTVGNDPADPSRVLIRKVVLVSENLYCFEETTLTPNNDAAPTVHTKLLRLKDINMKEQLP